MQAMLQKQADAQRQRESGPLQALEDIVPDNILMQPPTIQICYR